MSLRSVLNPSKQFVGRIIYYIPIDTNLTVYAHVLFSFFSCLALILFPCETRFRRRFKTNYRRSGSGGFVKENTKCRETASHPRGSVTCPSSSKLRKLSLISLKSPRVYTTAAGE